MDARTVFLAKAVKAGFDALAYAEEAADLLHEAADPAATAKVNEAHALISQAIDLLYETGYTRRP